MLSSNKSSNVIRSYDKSIDKRSAGVRRRADSLTRKPKLLIKQCKGIFNKGIDALYVLMDTWFFSDALIASLRELSLESICIIKKNLKFSFVGESQTKNLKQIFKSTHQRCNTSQIISSAIVQTKAGLRVKLVFVRNRNNRKEFITLLSTDIGLSAEKIVELYSRRWSIECCFKAAKQYLGLFSECFGRDFDTITVLNRIAYIRFAVLELTRRHQDDPRSHGQLFRDYCDEIKTIPFIDALESLSVCFESIVTELEKAGCIVKGMLREAYEIAKAIIND